MILVLVPCHWFYILKVPHRSSVNNFEIGLVLLEILQIFPNWDDILIYE